MHTYSCYAYCYIAENLCTENNIGLRQGSLKIHAYGLCMHVAGLDNTTLKCPLRYYVLQQEAMHLLKQYRYCSGVATSGYSIIQHAFASMCHN